MNEKIRYFNQKLLTLSRNEIDFFKLISFNPIRFSRLHEINKLGARYNIPIRQIRDLVELGYIYYFSNVIGYLDKNGGMAAFNKVIADYDKLPTLTTRTSTIIDLQQYSTPPPIAYLFGEFGGEVETVFDPTAGNGMLFLNIKAQKEYGNEISLYRLKNLNYQGVVTSYFDATKEFPNEYHKKFDFIVTNPPFGTYPATKFDEYEITSLEHFIVLKALETMKETGKAAIIVGGNVEYDQNGIIKPGKFRQFLFYLYSRYNVLDILNCSGDLYYTMGASFPFIIILISGITGQKKYPPRADFDLSTGTLNSPNQIVHFEAIKSRVENLIN